jgi:alkaline phosphatase D
MSASRREFLTSLAAAIALPQVPQRSLQRPAGASTFAHGVASGDPLADRVILWTRVTQANPAPAEVGWYVARDPAFSRGVARGLAGTDGSRDHTVKIDVPGLAPATTYYYRFEHRGVRSPIGRTRTLPVGQVDHVRLAVASCSNYPFGYFNAYGRIAARGDLDAVLHLGDYIYEYENGRYGDGTSLARIPAPNREIVTLEDYRTRYAQYRTDPDLQEVHRQHPFITVWDDHEVANNTWEGGAENHNPERGEGDWSDRKAAASRAYLEWMPVRERASRQIEIYRTFSFGDLMDLIMLDTRVAGRSSQVERDDVKGLTDPGRTLLGAAQEAWLGGELLASERAGAGWRVLGQQVVLGHVDREGGGISNSDAWDGYQASRSRLFDLIQRERITNPVVLSGDVHSSWALDVARDPRTPTSYDSETGRGALAAEFVTPAISSPGPFTRNMSAEEATKRTEALLGRNRHIKFMDGVQRGYMVLDVTRDACQADWFFVPTVTERTTEEHFGAAYATASGANHVVPRRAPARSSPGGPPPLQAGLRGAPPSCV